MKEQIKIYLSTCNKTSHILSATIFLYKKFITDLKPKFKILGFNKPNLSDWKDVEFISLSSSLQNISNWSLYLYNYFKTIDDKFIFFALDDFFPIDYFNKNVYDFLQKNLPAEIVNNIAEFRHGFDKPQYDMAMNEIKYGKCDCCMGGFNHIGEFGKCKCWCSSCNVLYADCGCGK